MNLSIYNTVENDRDFNAEESVETETYLSAQIFFAQSSPVQPANHISHVRRRERNIRFQDRTAVPPGVPFHDDGGKVIKVKGRRGRGGEADAEEGCMRKRTEITGAVLVAKR